MFIYSFTEEILIECPHCDRYCSGNEYTSHKGYCPCEAYIQRRENMMKEDSKEGYNKYLLVSKKEGRGGDRERDH